MIFITYDTSILQRNIDISSTIYDYKKLWT